MQIKNILVPVDFSPCSKNALLTAIEIARISKAKIHMVNSVHVHSHHPHVTGGLIEEIVAEYEEDVKRSFDSLNSELIELQEVPHEAKRFIAYLTDAIYTESKNKDIDLIVMGTRAEHEPMEHLLGSHTTDVIESSEVPVLVVPEGQRATSFRRIGLACEYSKEIHLCDFSILKNLIALYQAELLIFSVAQDAEKLTIQDQKSIEKLSKVFENEKSSVRTVEADSVIAGINSFSANHQLDLLAIIPKKRNFLERLFQKSVTKSMALDSELPLLIFKDI